jgi:hypothetical protein
MCRLSGFKFTTLVEIGTDCTGSCKSNYHMIMTTTHHAGLDINVCPIPVKTDVGQVDLVLRLSDGTSEKMTVLPIGGYFL